MPLFAAKKERPIESFIVYLLNNNCPEMQAMFEGPRLEGRVNLTLVVTVVPVEKHAPMTKKAFAAVTKEFSSKGVALVLNKPCGLDEVILGFRCQGDTTWIRAKAKHLSPMGSGFYQLGFRLVEKLVAAEYPELRQLR